ncbi:hypothetical protein L7F22_028845 [Adiantum nelumboides]|nr:hypothetical protein [Adiantum nelumboides]
MLTLLKSEYFNVKNMRTTYNSWEKLCDLYKQNSAALQVYWLKQLVDLKMKEGTTMSDHLDEFNTIFSNLDAQVVEFEDSVKALFLLITLPKRWDSFRTASSNSTPASGLTSANVESNLLTEEVNKKNLDNTHFGNALVDRGRSIDKGKSKDKRSKSKSHGHKSKDIEKYHCGKKGHMKKDCQIFKQEKGKEKKQEGNKKTKSSVKIKEVQKDLVDIMEDVDVVKEEPQELLGESKDRTRS